MLLFFYGWRHLKIVAFPLFFLTLGIPLPAILFNTISIPLQTLASTASAGFLNFCDVPVLQEGNVLQLASTSLGVAEACSGLRSLVSLIALAIILDICVGRECGSGCRSWRWQFQLRSC